MKRFLLLLAWLATTGAALARYQDPELQRIHRKFCDATAQSAERARVLADTAWKAAYYKAENRVESAAKARSIATIDLQYRRALQLLDTHQDEYEARGCY